MVTVLLQYEAVNDICLYAIPIACISSYFLFQHFSSIFRLESWKGDNPDSYY